MWHFKSLFQYKFKAPQNCGAFFIIKKESTILSYCKRMFLIEFLQNQLKKLPRKQ